MILYKVGAVTLALLCLVGCGMGREPEHTEVVRVLGVDGGESTLTLTAAGEPTREELMVATGRNWDEAREELRQSGERYPDTTHMSQLVVGMGTGLYDLLWECVAHRETGYNATVWLTEGPAGALLEGVGGGVARLEALEENVDTCSILDALVELEERGSVTLPVLTAEEGVLRVERYRSEEHRGADREA